MDMISQLPDGLLLSILSLLPSAKDVLATMVLSKRWKSLWMLVPKLVYDGTSEDTDYGSFSRFVDRSLFLHEAPVIETLHFKLGPTCGSGDIRVWIRGADKRCVRELIIEIDTCSSNKTQVTLPRSLYTCCRMLVTLELRNAVLVDEVSSSVFFPSLKTLRLESMKYPCDEFVNRLLSNCPVLEDLDVDQRPDDNVSIFTVKVPTLKSVYFCTSSNRNMDNEDGIVIDAPSLEDLDIYDTSGGFCVIESDMPNVVKARLVLSHGNSNPGVVLNSITSTKLLFLCIPYSKEVYPAGTVFHRLVYLEICTCETEWLNLFTCLLRDSPTLRALKLEQCHDLMADEPRPCWNEPSSIPECVLSSLETLEWVKYEGTEEEKEVAAFILRNASCLKKATISSKSTDPIEKLEMLKELSLSFRRSPTCQLAFDCCYCQTYLQQVI